MRRIVVDSSVVIQWYTLEPHSTEARRILHEHDAGFVGLLAPEFINAEIGNILWKKRIFQGMAAADAEAALSAFRRLTIVQTPSAELLGPAYQLAVTYRRTVYDMMYVALSVREACPFVTADQKLLNALGGAFPNAVWLGDWS